MAKFIVVQKTENGFSTIKEKDIIFSSLESACSDISSINLNYKDEVLVAKIVKKVVVKKTVSIEDAE